VLELLALGRSARDLAAELAMSPDTVRGHVQNLLMKPGVHSRLEAAARAIRPDPPPLPPAASAALAVPLQRTEDVLTHVGRPLRRQCDSRSRVV